MPLPPIEPAEGHGPLLPKNPEIQPTPYQGIAVDSKNVPRSSLLMHVEGMAWFVREYYSQYLNKDNETSAQQQGRSAVFQQYLRIRDLKIRVQEGLSSSFDEKAGEMQLRGTATIPPGTGFIPNKGDMFLADIGDGRAGVFTVTTVEQKSVRLNTVYGIEYVLKDYLTAPLHEDLRRKVVKDVVYVESLINRVGGPLLVDSEFAWYKEGHQLLLDLPQVYFDEFQSREFKTLIVPDQTAPVYDPYLTSFFVQLLDPHVAHFVRDVTVLNADDARNKVVRTIWDAFLSMRDCEIDFLQSKMTKIPTIQLFQMPIFGTIRWSGIPAVIYPLSDDWLRGGYDYLVRPQCIPLQPSQPRTVVRKKSLEATLPNRVLNGIEPTEFSPKPVPDIYPVTVDDYYVLSEHWYKGETENLSRLELLVNQLLNDEPIDHETLQRLCKVSYYWGALERFYYVPILICLLRVALEDF